MNIKRAQHKSYLKGMMLLLVFVVMLTGCLGKEDYQAYQDAALKTDAIQKGAQSVSVSVNQTLSKEAETHLNQATLKGLESIKFDLSGQFDLEKNLALFDVYLYYNDLGNDFKFIKKSETEQYVKIPMFSEYLKISENRFSEHDAGETADGEANSEAMSTDENAFKGIMEEINSEWHAMITAENIFVGEKMTIKNEDGDVKATKFTIKPTTDQLNLITSKIKESLLAHTDELADTINQYAQNGMLASGRISADTEGNNDPILNHSSDAFKMDSNGVTKLIESLMSSMTITHFEEIAYVDIDGYIIEETTSIGIKYLKNDQFESPYETQEINITTKRWGIEQTQKFDFPQIDESNSVPMESYDSNGKLNQ